MDVFENEVDYLTQYLKKGTYPEKFTKVQKRLLRKKSKHYCILGGKQLLYLN